MSNPEDSKPPTPPSKTDREVERARALAEVMKTEAEKVRRDRESRTRRTSFVGKYISLGIATLAFFYVFFATPPWLEPQQALPEPTAEQTQAAIRFAMFIQAQKIEAYRVREGRLPLDVADAGPPVAGVQYFRLGLNEYELITETPEAIVTYSSGQNLQEFLGESAEVLEIVGGPA